MPGNKTLPLKMPNLKKIMESGTTFTNAITPSPLCAPARACLAAGCSYETCGVADNSVDFPVDQPTFYAKLRDAGYQVGGVGKFDLHKPTLFWGLNGWVDDLGKIGFTTAVDNAGKIDAVVSAKNEPKDPYMKCLDEHGWRKYHINDMLDRDKKTHPTSLPADLYCDNWITENAIHVIRGFDKSAPWFIQVNFTGPHPPFDVTKEMKERWENVEFPYPVCSQENPQEAQGIRQNYAAMLENIDFCIGRILKTLKETDQYSNTLVVYASDHGEMLGDYNRHGKSRPELPSIHIPFVISGPGVQKGKRSEVLVELQDLAATFCDYANVAEKDFKDSISLRKLLEHREINKHRSFQKSALYERKDNQGESFLKNGWTCVQDEKYKVVEWNHEVRMYYNRWDDKEKDMDAERKKNLEKHLN